MRHVPGIKNTVADGLSRWLVTEEDIKEIKNNNTDKFLDAQFLSIFRVSLITADLGEQPQEFKINPVEISDEGDDDGNILKTLEEEWSEKL